MKELYIIALESCYVFTKTMWSMELNMMLIVDSLNILDNPELYSRFNEYLAI